MVSLGASPTDFFEVSSSGPIIRGIKSSSPSSNISTLSEGTLGASFPNGISIDNLSNNNSTDRPEESIWYANKELFAIIGGVVGFWGGVFGLGLVFLIFACIRRLRKGIGLTGDGRGAQRTPVREDQQPRERRKRLHHCQNFYGSGRRSGFGRHDDSGGGISLTRLGFGVSDRGSRSDGSGGHSGVVGGLYSHGGGARIKFGGVSFRSRDQHDQISSQL